MIAVVRIVPNTKLWKQGDDDLIVLECECGLAVDYPGHPDERTEVVCESCGIQWRIAGHVEAVH